MQEQQLRKFIFHSEGENLLNLNEDWTESNVGTGPSPFVLVPAIRGIMEIRPLLEAVRGYGIVAGGYARYCCTTTYAPVMPSDVDIWFPNTKALDSFKKYIHDKLCPDFGTPRHDSVHAVSYNRPAHGPFSQHPQVQLIKPREESEEIGVYSFARKVMDDFDFTVCQAALVSSTTCMVSHTFKPHDDGCALFFNQTKRNFDPAKELFRIMHYVNKGYYFNIDSARKFIKAAAIQVFEKAEEAMQNSRNCGETTCLLDEVDNLFKNIPGPEIEEARERFEADRHKRNNRDFY
jgi:hypothetical protein